LQGTDLASSNCTMLFRTRQGTAGILQIAGYTEKPKGVKIRYKLVQKASPGSAEVPTSADAKPEKPAERKKAK
jgi:hypothetical protein